MNPPVTSSCGSLIFQETERLYNLQNCSCTVDTQDFHLADYSLWKMKLITAFEVNSFILSNFNYCPLMWHFSSCESIRKIEKIWKGCLRIILNDYESDHEALLHNSNKPTMEIRRLRTLAVEIFTTLNEINPPYMKNIFKPKENAKVKQNDTIVECINTSRFVAQSLSSLGPKIWNNLPPNIKPETSFLKFKEYIKTWLGPKCRCKVGINMWTENVLLVCIYLNLSSVYIYL